MDGCFDMMHYGHANALRQVRTMSVNSNGCSASTKSRTWKAGTGTCCRRSPQKCLLVSTHQLTVRSMLPALAGAWGVFRSQVHVRCHRLFDQ